ncbi:MAG: alpha-2-macroglobulin family protein, partial [Victivallales bacterium]|nr:alpha-2-macroglobulin family protein [Victivallales bacterium]
MGIFHRSAAVALAALSLTVALQATENNRQTPTRPTSKQLGGQERYLLYAATDKPIYRAGEKVYLRAVMLNAADNTPLKNGNAEIKVKITDARKAEVFSGYATVRDSSAGSHWTIPNGQPGGVYTATFSSPYPGAPETVRKFEVRAYRAPRLKSQIEFVRQGYGPGDTVSAAINVTRAEGGIPAGAKITAVARVDGHEVFRQSGLTVNRDGNCTVTFTLPRKLAVGDGTLSFVIEDGGVKESAGKTIPILLPAVDIAFYPEGGELVAGLPCRIYVQANRPDGKPADLEGTIVPADATGTEAALHTVHEGRGVVTMTPQAGVKYELKLTQPSGIARTFPLPPVKPSGAVLRADRNVYPYDGPVRVTVAATADSKAATITLGKREVELDSQPLEPGRTVSRDLNAHDAEGVLIATVWDKNGLPLAERLVYRQPKYKINVSIKATAAPFVPGGKVKLDLLTTDDDGKPVEAVVGLTVTDDAVLQMIDKREQAPRLPVMVYLENEVADLADAAVYLDATNPQATTDVDLLLGTQGWRRFILVDYEAIKKQHPEMAKRALAECHRPEAPVLFAAGAAMPEMRDKACDGEDAVAAADEKKAIEFNRVNARMVPAPHVAEDMAAAPIMGFKPLPQPEKLVMHKELRSPVRIVVREYAHKVRPNRRPNDRIDFTETIYWHAGLRTSARNGRATVEFDLPDSVTTFAVMADAFGNNGALGTGNAAVTAVEPFYIEPKMPLTATVGDIIELPVALINATDQSFAAVNVLVRGEGLDIVQPEACRLNAGQRTRVLAQIMPKKPGDYKLAVSAAAAGYTDQVTRTLTVSPQGFPVAINHGGLLDAAHPASFTVTVPPAVEPGSMQTSAKLFPTPLANMEEALNALLQQPCGCFEQTSSTNYPLVMAQQYFLSHHNIAPDKIAQARRLLDAGYQKLAGFECKQKGYEWFGGDPGHEALTAYGLMEFADMNKVMPVDTAMVARTRQWLLQRRDDRGGFKRNQKALDSFGRAPAPITNAYIVWALLESGEKPATLAREIAAVKSRFTRQGSYL